jgi:hypothetical protein
LASGYLVDDALEANFQNLKLKMLLYSNDYPEAAEIGYRVDNALEAGFQYLKLKMLL